MVWQLESDMKVLIVDDNVEDRKLLSLYLKEKECETLEASDGRAGLELVLRHRPDLVISDGLMPVMDGFQLLHALRSNPETAPIPFIFFSATYTGVREVELGLSLGAAAFIVKPKGPAEFWEELSNALQSCSRPRVLLPHGSECEFLKEYSTVVAAKLEEKCRELERVNASLTESETRHRALFENTPATMLLVDPDTAEILDLNTAAAEFYGFPREALRRMRLTDLSVVPQLELASLAEARRGAQHVERQHRLRSGAVREVEIYRGPLVIDNRVCIFSIIHDVSQRKSLENQLRQAQKMEAIGTLSGGIAHDFNNILTVILGFVTLLKGRLADSEDAISRGYLDNILAASTRAADMVKSLLVFSRNQPLSMKPVNLHDVVTGMKKLLERLIHEDIELVVQRPEEPVLVMADEGQLGQVLMNLASNARAAMPRSGTITVSFSRALVDEAFIEAHGYGNFGNHAVLRFSDTGEGMDDETRRRIFEPFFTTKAVGEGTGLGLSTVYGIVRQHCGFIHCSSAPGAGTTFEIYLPLIKEAPGKRRDRAGSAPTGGSETVLLAEDDGMVRYLVRGVLEQAGYTVIEAGNGEEAVQKFRAHAEKIRLVILDVVMPKKSGAEVVSEIRAAAPEVKVVFLSGYHESAQANRLPEQGIPLIMKPVSPHDLLVKVREAITG